MSSFTEKVYEIISPILLKYDIRSVREDPEGDRITFFNNKVAVGLTKDYRDQTIFVGFKDVKERKQFERAQLSETQENKGTYIALEDVLHYRNKDKIEYIYPRSFPITPREEERILRAIAECLENYCDDILRGDFSIHVLTDKLVEDRVKSFIESSPEQNRNEWRKIYKINED